MMAHAVTQLDLFTRQLSQAMLQDLDLAANVHQEAADEAVTTDADGGAVKRAKRLLGVHEAEHSEGRCVIIWHPFSIHQFLVREVGEQRRQGDRSARDGDHHRVI